MQVTLGLLTYNHEKFVVPALRAVLQQTYRPLQVLITDDASTDRTQQLIRAELERYKGSHKVQFYANAQNRGLSQNINHHMALATGELYVIAAGDDISYPNRVERLVEAFLASGPETMSLHSNARIIDESGNGLRSYFQQDPPSFVCRNTDDARQFHGVWVLGASHAWNRRVFDVFGPLPAGIDIEDWVIPFRSGLIGKIVYVNEVLVDYRRHGSNMSFVDVWSGSRKWYADKLRLVERLIPTLGCIEKDLALAQQVLPGKKMVVAALQEVNQRVVRELMDSRDLFQNNVSFSRKMLMAGKYFRSGGGVKKGVVWLLTYFCPSLYLKYIQFRLRGLAKRGVDYREA